VLTNQIALVLTDARLARQVVADIAWPKGWRHWVLVPAPLKVLLAEV